MPTEYNAGENQEVVVKVVLDDAAQMAHYVHWQGEGWYRDVALGVAQKYMRWTYATPEEMREYPCQYLHHAGSVVLPNVFVSNTVAFVHVSPREDDNPLAALEAEWTEIDEWVKGLDFSDL